MLSAMSLNVRRNNAGDRAARSLGLREHSGTLDYMAQRTSSQARGRLASAPFPFLLLVDAEDRPVGWLAGKDLPADGSVIGDKAIAMSPLQW